MRRLVDIDKIKANAWYTVDNEIDVKIEYMAKQQDVSRRLNFVVDVETQYIMITTKWCFIISFKW